MRIGALIVAAGLSSRMGAFKPMLPLGDTTVIGRSVQTLLNCGVSPVVVVTGRESERLTAYLEPFGAECICNERFAETDMFYSACMGMHRLLDRTDRFYFLPADSPLFSKETLSALNKRMDEGDCDVIRPCFKGRGGHPILINSAKLHALLAFSGDGGMRRAFEFAECREIKLECGDIGITMDADTPEDYKRMLEYVSTQK